MKPHKVVSRVKKASPSIKSINGDTDHTDGPEGGGGTVGGFPKPASDEDLTMLDVGCSIAIANGSKTNNQKEHAQMKTKKSGIGEFNLTEKEVETTNRYVALLNKTATCEVNDWFKKGEIITGYINELRKEGAPRTDYHKILAGHDACPYGASQLRYWEAAWTLRNSFGGDTCDINLPMTHWTVVLHAHVHTEVKQEILKQAEEEKWTVRQLKEHIRIRFSEKRKVNATIPAQPTLQQSLEQLNKYIKISYSVISSLNNQKGKNTIPDQAKESLLCLCRAAIHQGFFTVEELANKVECADGNHEDVPSVSSVSGIEKAA